MVILENNEELVLRTLLRGISFNLEDLDVQKPAVHRLRQLADLPQAACTSRRELSFVNRTRWSGI
ncbi:hypothetical protein O9992_25870 [Vibrio lentus]|nr:hypothetical protein [Vibrio lentus]